MKTHSAEISIEPSTRVAPRSHIRTNRQVSVASESRLRQLNAPAASVAPAFSFGPFRLFPARRLLLEGEKPVRLGSRALDILIALVERAGELVSKDELMVRIWPNTFVEPANLTVHIAALRRSLGGGRGDDRFLTNIPGRGYLFVAPVKISEELAPSPLEPAVVAHLHNLPAPITRLIGRKDAVTGLAEQLSRGRFITIVGPGGIGKTSVALAAAEELLANYRHGVWLTNLEPVRNPQDVPAAVACALRVKIQAKNPLPGLLASLKGKQMLLVLDNCEHVITAAAGLAAAVLRGAPGIRILATSREPLRTDGERVYRLRPLESPPVAPSISAEEALRFPAIQLFVERAAAALGEFALGDADAPIVVEICSKLDGIPLAIELAAGRVNCFGIGGIAAHFDSRLDLLCGGSRTALPRQQTMRATLDWSYSLLSKAEQRVLRRLSIFSGTFTLEAAGTVISDDTCLSNDIYEHITELAAKSLVAVEASDAEPRLKLLETTRAYAFAKLAESGEMNLIARRHAEYWRALGG